MSKSTLSRFRKISRLLNKTFVFFNHVRITKSALSTTEHSLRGQYSFRGLKTVNCDRVHSSLTAVHCFDNDYVGKQLVARKEYCAKNWIKELQESMDRCTGRRDETEILLKNGVKHHTINQSINQSINNRILTFSSIYIHFITLKKKL